MSVQSSVRAFFAGAVALAMGCLLVVISASAQVPSTMNYQGRLLENAPGEGPAIGPVDIVFSLWSGPESDLAAVQLWTESWDDVVLASGIFSVLLGSNGSPFDAATFQGDTSLFLELVIDGETLAPRQALGAAPFAMVDEPANELQDLELTGDTLGLSSSAATVDLSPYLDDTDAQDLSLSGDTLGLSGSAATVDLAPYLDNTDAQDLSLSGETLGLTGSAATVDLAPYLDNTDAQDLSLSGDTLGLTGSAATVDLSPYLDDTDAQDLSLSGATLSLTDDPTPVDLSAFLDDTDAQTLGFGGTTLTISGSGSSVDLASLLDDTDAQTLALNGDTLTISGSGSSVDLAVAAVIVDLLARVAALEALAEPRTVFVTSQAYNADFGGVAAADERCQDLAGAAGLSGTFLAWLSDPTGSPSTRFVHGNLPFVRVDGERIADDWADLTDGTLAAPIDLDELGNPIESFAWTGTKDDGTPDTANTWCNDWTSVSALDVGTAGGTDQTNFQWSRLGSLPCDGEAQLYCFEN